MKQLIFAIFAGLCLTFSLEIQAQNASGISNVWVSDNGNGTYTNPILYADYSDPEFGNCMVTAENAIVSWSEPLLVQTGKRMIDSSLISATSLCAANYDFVVAADGSGDFKTVQEAINAVPDFRKNETVILIKNGTYKEKLVLAGSKTNVVFVGENRDKTILTYDDFASKKNRFGEEVGTTGSTSFFAFGDGFRAENITFENSSGPVGQAVAVRVDGDQVVFNNCRFSGFQDTLYPHGEKSHQYYKNCIIEGTVDFIFGWSTAVFDSCTIVCKDHGFVTAPSTNEGTLFGFVFLNCIITGDATEASFYLGRPWRPFAKSAFLNCELGSMIKQQGWNNWNKPEAEKESFFAEYKNTGPGASSETRVKWSHQLTNEEAAAYTPENILGDWVKKFR